MLVQAVDDLRHLDLEPRKLRKLLPGAALNSSLYRRRPRIFHFLYINSLKYLEKMRRVCGRICDEISRLI